MNIQSVNISSNEMKEQLALGTLPAGWTVEANNQDALCINTPTYELGYIVTLNMNSVVGYNFTVHEFQLNLETGFDYEHDDSFNSYDEVLNYIERRIEGFK